MVGRRVLTVPRCREVSISARCGRALSPLVLHEHARTPAPLIACQQRLSLPPRPGTSAAMCF